ncbi:hypothetical protein FOL46_004620 [Perkinsus olseni]|uniref:Uncharacterized protein n=1 Tax=Perkinsus olseni TaxID=32597 RepID=A0A7J6LWP4_PEROL|nr:hypothetical protein FOL46_004620 [Perkinsus olseni]
MVMLPTAGQLGRVLLYLAALGNGKFLKLPHGIYKNRDPIVGYGLLKAIELDVKGSERRQEGKAKLKMAGSFRDRDLVLSMSEHCDISSTRSTLKLLAPELVGSQECLTFAPGTSKQIKELFTVTSTMYSELRINLPLRNNVEKAITICSVREELVMYLAVSLGEQQGTARLLNPIILEPASLSLPMLMENTVTPIRRPSLPSSYKALTVDRLILPRVGTLVKNGRAEDDIYVVIKETALVARQAELIITSTSMKPVNLTINDHYKKYTYRDKRFPGANLTAISLPPLPLSHSGFILSNTELERGMVLVQLKKRWIFLIDNNDGPLRDFATSVAEALKIKRLDVRGIFLCYLDSVWYIKIGPVRAAMRYSDDDSVDDDQQEEVNRMPGTVRPSSMVHHDDESPRKRLRKMMQ